MTNKDKVGYTLTLHNQLETAKVDSELRDMTKELQKLTQDTVDLTTEMRKLTQDTVDDSVTVKIITLLSAIYIPGSFVGVRIVSLPHYSNLAADYVKTMFGMNFFVFNPVQKRIVIAHDFWIFIATWLPLTLLTAGLYVLIVWLDARSNGKEVRWLWKIKKSNVAQAHTEAADSKLVMDSA